jgi:hypothetical protein
MAPKFMKSIDKVAQGITTNKYVLYVVLCLAIVNVVTFLATDNFISLAIFALVGFLATRFTKNMIIVMLSTLIISTILHVSRKTVEGLTTEGMDGDKDDEKEEEEDTDTEEEEEDDEEEEEGTSVAGTDDDTERKEGMKGMKGMKGKKKQNKQSSGVPREPSGVPPRESSGVPRKPPPPHVATTTDGFNTQDAAPYVNEKKTKAAAFNNITKGLGGANISQMNADTQDLLKHQDSLTAAMKGMQPMIQQAGDMLKQLDSTGLTDILGNLGGMNFGGKKKNN